MIFWPPAASEKILAEKPRFSGGTLIKLTTTITSPSFTCYKPDFLPNFSAF